jgi:hypothetical protein
MAKAKGNRNDARKNGKAWKKPERKGDPHMEKTNFSHVKGRTAESHAKREAWKDRKGPANPSTIPHWKTGKLYKEPTYSLLIKTVV